MTTRPAGGASDTRRTRHARTRTARLIPANGSVDDLVAAIGRSRGRPITLLPVQLDAGSPSGFWLATDRADYVVHPADASASERTAIICHELAHMVLDHRPEVRIDQQAQLAALVAPSVDPTVARQFLARHGYADGLEAEAEHLATVLVTRLQRRAHADAVRSDAVSDRLR